MTTDITRKLGDTFDESCPVKNKSAVLDSTGFSFLLTVDTNKTPVDESTKVFQVAGNIPVGTDGVVTFTISTDNADITPATYFYDIQMTDTSSKITTLVIGTWNIIHDITK